MKPLIKASAPVIGPIRVFRRSASLAIGGALAVSLLIGAPRAQAEPNPAQALPRERPDAANLASFTSTGSYLASRHASIERDAASASDFYREALKADPANRELRDRAFISALAGGDIDSAVVLSRVILKSDADNRIARLVLGIADLKAKKYATARRNLSRSVRGPITDLVGTLLTGWALQGQGRTRQAIALVDKLSGPEWYGVFKDLHSGLMADLGGQSREAGTRYKRAFDLDNSALRVVDAYARWASRHESKDGAKAIYAAFSEKLPDHPLVVDAEKMLGEGKVLGPLLTTPQEGAAEVLYGLGASLGRRGGEDLALVYLQLALYLAPGHEMALLSLGDLYETIKRPQMALPIYERIPAASPLWRNAQIQLANDLNSVERKDDAIKILQGLVASDATDIEAIMALGNIQRSAKQFGECATTYSMALKANSAADIKTNDAKKNWVIHYFRGICYERSKQWAKAEIDLKKALEQEPEQAHVLNYLGYSWIDQGVNLDDGLKMIKRAVEQRPDDGYIVDSLGWAYYRIGRYDEAVKQLERAIELKPQDPTINDHLGDAYWRVGRTLEAKFQWAHARDLDPDPADLPKIEAKIRDGLSATEQATPKATTAEQDKKSGNGG